MEQVNDDDMGRKDQYMLKVVDMHRHCYVTPPVITYWAEGT